MDDSIRELIIQRFVALGAGIRTASGYNTNIGASAFRAASEIDKAALPAHNVVPLSEQAEQKYGRDHMIMLVQLEGFAEHGDTNTSVVAEQILADLRKRYTLPSIKDTGYSPAAITTGFTGKASATTNQLVFTQAADSAKVKVGAVVTLAAGTEPVRHILAANGTNTWTTRERGTIAAGTTITSIQPPPLVESVQYRSGGMDTYAKAGEKTTGCMIQVEVKYSTLIGNPYEQ